MQRLVSIAFIVVLCAFGGMAEETLAPAPLPASTGLAAGTNAAPGAFTEADAPYDGIWQPFEDGFKLYLPRDWASMALSKAQAEAGLFYRAGSADGATGVAVGYMDAGTLETTEALAGDFARSGYTSVVQGSLNGIPAIGFERPQDGYRGVAFFHPVYPDYVLFVYVSPLGSLDDESGEIGKSVLASITPLEV